MTERSVLQQNPPNFLIIGAQRAGSTWLWHALRAHPAFFLPQQKELEFFSYASNLTAAGWRGYLANFSAAGGYQWRGESSPSYLLRVQANSPWRSHKRGFNRAIPEAVAEYLGPDTKLVVSLRDPVERAVSALFHHAAHGRIPKGEGLLEAGRRYNIVDMGFYARHLASWLEVFPPEQLLICHFEDISTRPALVLDQLAEFFGVAQWPDSEALLGPQNPGQTTIRLLGNELPIRQPWRGPLVTPKARRRLADIYAEDQETLREILSTHCSATETPTHAW